MATLYHQVWINAPVSKVYEALATADGLSKWWAPHFATETETGLILAHSAGVELGDVKMEVLDTVQDKRVEWKIVSDHPKRSPASAWTGTRIRFELAERKNPGHRLGIHGGRPRMTVVDFRHSGWDKGSKYFGFCNSAWGETLLLLKRWCESREPITRWLDEALENEVVVDPERINVEAISNMSILTISEEEANPDTLAIAADFLRLVVRFRASQLRERGYPPGSMVFYCWRDDLLAQLRFSMVSSCHGSLPFGCELRSVEDLETIVSSWLVWEILHPDDPRAKEDAAVLDGDAPFELDVWTASL